MTWVDWIVHGIAIFILAGWFGAPDAILDGDYRLAIMIFVAATATWGWVWERLKSSDHKAPDWDARPPRPKPVAYEDLHWVQNQRGRDGVPSSGIPE